MSEYLTEDQQLEALKQFWKENGLTIVASIVLAISMVVGIRFYRHHIQIQSQQASVIYQRVMVSNNNAETLLKNYPSTPYAKFAALLLAKQSIAATKYDDAMTQLNWTLRHTHNPSIAEIARIRLARIDLEQNKANDALTVLNKINDKTYQGLIDETRGDAYVQLNQLDQARTAYQNALTQYTNANINRPILEMKMNDLPNKK